MASLQATWVRLLTAPGLALQALSAREPDHGMVEVALVALKKVLAADAAMTALEATRGIAGSDLLG